MPRPTFEFGGTTTGFGSLSAIDSAGATGGGEVRGFTTAPGT